MEYLDGCCHLYNTIQNIRLDSHYHTRNACICVHIKSVVRDDVKWNLVEKIKHFNHS